ALWGRFATVTPGPRCRSSLYGSSALPATVFAPERAEIHISGIGPATNVTTAYPRLAGSSASTRQSSSHRVPESRASSAGRAARIGNVGRAALTAETALDRGRGCHAGRPPRRKTPTPTGARPVPLRLITASPEGERFVAKTSLEPSGAQLGEES